MLEQRIHPELWELAETVVWGDADFYAQYARISGGPVLVLFSGAGRIVIPIARQSIPVMGLETDAAMVELAKRKAQESGAGRALFVRGDPTNFHSGARHALVIIPGGALGRLLTKEDQRACLIAVRGSLQLGGKLLLDLPLVDESTFRTAEPPLIRHLPGESRLAIIQRSRWPDPTRQVVEELVTCEWAEGGQVKAKEILRRSYRFMTPSEVLLLLEGCGFTAVTWGGFDQRPFLPGATRLVIEASRR